jgi:hypothetical protein
MSSILKCGVLFLVLLPACVGEPKKPAPDPRKELINTICGKCPCEHVHTEGEDVSADCYEPQPKERSHGRST